MEGFDLKNLLNPEHWLAMDENGSWYLYKQKPINSGWCWLEKNEHIYLDSDFFNFPACENWEDSLIQVKDLIKD
jgi:hypothetical protein